MSEELSSWRARVEARNAEIRAHGRWRSICTLEGGAAETRIAATGQGVVSFASNDYLGLSQHPALAEAAHAAIRRFGTGYGASRLVVGARPIHAELERELAEWKGAEAALLFPTGFAANVGLLTALGRLGDVCIASDELNHASIIDGARLSRARVSVYRHGDLAQLESILAANERAVVVSDSVFSMDGDLAPVAELAELVRAPRRAARARRGARRAGPAHAAASGARGARGRHAVEDARLARRLRGGPARVRGPAREQRAHVHLHDRIVPGRRRRGARGAAHRALGGRGGPRVAPPRQRGAPAPGPSRRRSCRSCSARRSAPWRPRRALLERGLLVPAIRPPTVPPGTSRLRVALSAAHTPEQVDALATALAELGCPAS